MGAREYDVAAEALALMVAPDLIDARTIEGLPGSCVVLASTEAGYRVTVERHGEELFTLDYPDREAAAFAYVHPFAVRPEHIPDPWNNKPPKGR